MKKRLMFVALAFCFLIFSRSQYVDAVMPASYVISSGSCSISTSSESYSSSIRLTNYGNGTVTMTLQRKNGSTWLDVKSYTKSFSSSIAVTLEDSATLTKGYTYRCQVNVDATVNGISESKTYYSNEVTN